ncbi:MAG: efflux transporter outer membrane subunit [Verrucomicrobia bacterium]|nr:efflux transporter outer membrane subunit [Verrucomicrobiota bacterium]
MNPSWLILGTVFALAGVGCASRRPAEPQTPWVTPAGTYQEVPAEAAAARAEAGRPWWQSFEDPVLRELVETALAGNLELQSLAARVEQADAVVRQAGARLYPAIEGSGRYAASWSELEDAGERTRAESAALGLSLSWELDVWGRLRSARQAAWLEAQATVATWQGGRLLLNAAVAETYFEILELGRQLDLIESQIEANQTLLELTRLRFGQGLSAVVDVLQQREQLAGTRARVPVLEGRLAQLEYALDVLLGRAPGERPRTPGLALDLPPRWLGAGVPSDLLRQRPDLRSAGWEVAAIDQRVAEAIADRLPRFVLGGSLEAVGDAGFQSLVGTTLASLAGPVFEAGERKAEVTRRRARLRERLAGYSEAYLTAVREVETAFALERKQGERVGLLADQLVTAQLLLTETQNRYAQGLTDYLPVLNALVTKQSLEREVLTSRRQLLSDRVALHRALGGPMGEPPTPAARRWAAGDLKP